MPGGRPRLPIGGYGDISVTPEARPNGKPAYRAKARYRGSDGTTRAVVRYGQTKTRARDSLRAALAEMQDATRTGTVNGATPLAALADLWYERTRPDWSTGTADTYTYIIGGHVKPLLGNVRLAEITHSNVHDALAAVRDRHGPGAAKTTKTVLSGMFQLAMREGALNANPALGSIRLAAKTRRRPRALTPGEADRLVDTFRADPTAVDLDLPDLVEWMLGFGCRIGEALAARYDVNDDGDQVLDLDARTWEINATLKRVNGVGLVIQKRPKTAAGWRTLAMPAFTVEMLARRADELRFHAPDGVVFGSPHRAALRDPSNTAGDLRAALDRARFDWVTSHTFRKTAATRLEESGCTAREVADQLGHSRPSMTLDVYMGRNVVSAKAAQILDR